MKYAHIASERTHYPIGFMCRMLEVSTSGLFSAVSESFFATLKSEKANGL